MAGKNKKAKLVELPLEKLKLVVGGAMQTPHERHGYNHKHGNRRCG